MTQIHICSDIYIHHMIILTHEVEVPGHHEPVSPVVPRPRHHQHRPPGTERGRGELRGQGVSAGQAGQLHQLHHGEPEVIEQLEVQVDGLLLAEVAHHAPQLTSDLATVTS